MINILDRKKTLLFQLAMNTYKWIASQQCEECGKTGVPLMVVIFSVKNKSKPNTLYTDSLYMCGECLNKSESHDEKSRTIH